MNTNLTPVSPAAALTGAAPSTDSWRIALVAGSTGLVGRAVLALLLADVRYSAVHVVGRRAPDVQHPKLVVHNTAALAGWTCPVPVDDVLICLGTTIKIAGSKAAFKAIDADAVVAVAKAAKAAGATRLAVVSAMGASPASGVFYNHVKGEMEAAVSALDFESIVIARPSLLAGDRHALQQQARGLEKLSLIAFKWLKPLIPDNYRSIDAGKVARAMVNTLRTNRAGAVVLSSGNMQDA